MSKKHPPQSITAISLGLGILLSCSPLLQTAATAGVLKGGVQDTNTLKGPPVGPGLSRTDVKSNDDPFGNEQTEQQQFAPASFAVESTAPPMPPPKKAFPLNADTDGDAFNPQMGTPMQDRAPQQDQQPHQLGAQTPNQFSSQDPESSGEMKLAWDAWHKQVASIIYQRYSTLSNAAFARSRRPMAASASYVVTRDGRIINAQLLVPSSNPIYNTLILGVINSISGDMSLLAFPRGSHRMMVEKSATFSQNGGNEGYKFLTGDQETIQQKQMRMQQQQQLQQQQQFQQRQQYGGR